MFWNPLYGIGSGVGIEIRDGDLVVALVRSGWKGATVAGRAVLAGFRRRPPAEWGAEYQEFLRSHGFRDLPATLLAPRHEAMVRLLDLPAAARSGLASAVRLQIDSLHPFGEEDVYFSHAPLGRPASPDAPLPVAVVIASRALIDGYADRFAEAGVKLGGVTVAAAAYWGATRLLRRRPPEPFLLVDQHDSQYELYGESETRPFFSAAFDARSMPLEKALAAAASELRLPAESALLVACGEASGAASAPAESVLGSPLEAPSEFDLKRDATVLAAALAAACPRWGWRVNLLPAARRSSSARWPMAITAATAASAAVVALALGLRGPVQDRRYAAALEREVKALEAVEREVLALEQRAQQVRRKRAQLETFRRRAEADLTLVTEISRRLPGNVWLSQLEAGDDALTVAGQAESAAPLLALLDHSGLVSNAAFASSITRNENREVFRIRAARRPGLARTQ